MMDLRKEVKEWYNGYKFSKNASSVYNPFSLMNALDAQDFRNYWFQSGTPTFLVEILKKEYRSFDPSYLTMSDDLLQGIFEVNETPLLVAMFQAGCLTIAHYDQKSQMYQLDYPNAEAKDGFRFLGLSFKRNPGSFDVTSAVKEL